jgi:hypothetical protein|tara:strand:- start:2233 stop:3213 length:981 start_codon:yes stop_codon:yes gene_type:complete
MKNIPTFIKAKNPDTNKYSIPKIIIQTYKNDYIHERVYQNIINFLNLNPDHDYYLITDEIGIDLIKKNFDKEVFDAFDKLHIGAAKGDFLRYIAIYIYGGIYIDLDSSIGKNLNRYIDYNMDHYIIYDQGKNIMNTPIISKPKNPIILNIIKEVVKRVNNYEYNIFLATGPSVMTDVIYKDITNKDIFYVSQKTSSIERGELWHENQNYKNGKIFHRSHFEGCSGSNGCIQFRMHNYSSDLLYPDNDKYKATFNSPTPFLYKYIYIGNSEISTKIVKLNKLYESNTKLVFIKDNKHEFSYEFKDYELIIKRIDIDQGWKHDLIVYL